uniref:Condensin complex subunit 2 n=1 Tax=Callorhinchus milii TaxID=7868 RepID=A0A4W3I3Z8_CALMI|eukprot:gi/632977942/ref/XP_007905628.1/ PREDICTED: condensin complex subunit 2 [Callorhinchus milii]
MTTSTPQFQGDKMAERTSASSGAKRQAVQSAGAAMLLSVAGNDDERERRERRRSRLIDLQLSNTESPLVSPATRSTPQFCNATLSNNQISEHYSTCIKLCSENKITAKNAFGLHLIDYMADLLKERDSELINFKMAAGTLDASAKIYAVRVDAIHSDVFRVLGGLGKNPETADKAEESSRNKLDADGNPKNPQKQWRKKHSYKTIEQNLNNITYSAADIKCENDPMFQKAAFSFDEGSTMGVFLMNLQTYGHCSELLFDSDVKLLQTGPAPPPVPLTYVEISGLAALQQSVEGKRICPSFEDFQFTKWDSEAEDQQLVSSIMDRFKKSEHLFDMDAEPEFGDQDDAPEDAFDGDLCDDDGGGGDQGGTTFTEHREACKIDRVGVSQEVVTLGAGDFGSLCLQLSQQPGEYSYFSPRMMKMWAGPEHWRFRARHKADVVTVGETRKKTAKKSFEIDLNEEIVFETYFRKTKASTIISHAALGKHSKKLTTLPADFHYNPDHLIRLSLKPSITLKWTVPESVSSEQDEGIGEYDYNNANDTSNFCPGVQIDSDDEQDGFVADAGLEQGECGIEPGSNQLNITTYRGENLVAEPHRVNKILLNYEKTAKKVDVKRLKQNMWQLLTEVPERENGITEEILVDAVKGEQSFTAITKRLFERLPNSMAKNLSIPLAFACLLHLANEKNLEILGQEDLSDVLIKQGI